MLNILLNNLSTYSDRTSFHIDRISYTYKDLKEKIFQIHKSLLDINISKNDVVAVITNNDIETYASVFAIWFAGATFLPINPKQPVERNFKIISQVDVTCLISSNEFDKGHFERDLPFICSRKINTSSHTIEKVDVDQDHILYIIFTSGSTGSPKGVTISLENFHSFMDSFLSLGYNLNQEDRFLQIYDLSFDASFHCYVLPMYLGASVYPVNPLGIKYLEAIKLMNRHKLTFAKMPPSTLTFLKPYFSTIQLPDLTYSLFGGEALSADLVSLWKDCAPKAEIHNVYGPTEVTINCMYYKCSENLKFINGIVSIGKTSSNLKVVIVDENNNIIEDNNKGELCFAGNQVTPGYSNDEEKNNASFFTTNIENELLRFYKTGDLAFKDRDGDYFYLGRVDNQVQIQGYRVELGEIESAAMEIIDNNCVVISDDTNGVLELILVVENYNEEINLLKEKIVKKIPLYMIPNKIISIDQFPYNVNGKIDRNQIKEMVLN